MRLPILLRVGLNVVYVVAGLFVFSLIVSSVDRARYRANVAEALESGALAERAYLPLNTGNSPHRYHYNDCLILGMLVLEPQGSWIQNALSPLRPVRQPQTIADEPFPPKPFCRALPFALRRPGENAGYYHRYLHGDWVLSGLLLAVLSFSAATALLLFIAFTVPMLTLARAVRRLFSGRPEGAQRDAAYAAVAAVVVLFYGLSLYGWSLSFAPSDIILFAFLYFAYRSPLGSLSEKRFVSAVTLLAAFTTTFEFLIGALPAALALVLASLAFEQGTDPLVRIRRALLGTACFLLAVTLAFAAKALAVGLAWGPGELVQAGERLADWTRVERWGIAPENAARLAEYGVHVSWLQCCRITSTLFALAKMAYFSSYLGLGSLALGATVMLGGAVLLPPFAIYRAHRSRSPEVRVQGLLLALASAVILGWYLLFVSHAIEHAEFMGRPLVWLTAFLAGLIAWRVSEGGFRPLRRTAG